MIDAKELRIGNLVYRDKRKEPVPMILPYFSHLHRLDPVSITEERLFRFKFEKINSTWYGFGNFRINSSLDVEWANRWMGVRLKYIHQLQNLYFALTGQELELKE